MSTVNIKMSFDIKQVIKWATFILIASLFIFPFIGERAESKDGKEWAKYISGESLAYLLFQGKLTPGEFRAAAEQLVLVLADEIAVEAAVTQNGQDLLVGDAGLAAALVNVVELAMHLEAVWDDVLQLLQQARQILIWVALMVASMAALQMQVLLKALPKMM